MPSPFPGMNPYFESSAVFDQFHKKLINEIQDVLVVEAGDAYIVKSDQTVYIHEPTAEERREFGRPDVFISEKRAHNRSATSALAPFPTYGTIPEWLEEEISGIQIIDKQFKRVITAIEVLSPTNKIKGSHRDQYLAKRATLIGHGNFVEIDLLRGHPRTPVTGLPPCDYCVIVARPQEWPRCGLWPISLRDRLPVIPIPLREEDGSIFLDLQDVLNRAYDAGGFKNYIYDETPDPPLAAEDAAWAEALAPPK